MFVYDKNLIVSLIDLTSLNDSDNNDVITSLCNKALLNKSKVASVCVYDKYIALANKILCNSNIEIATVVNFPLGSSNLDIVVSQTKEALRSGATEIDLVIPYQEYIKNGKSLNAMNLIKACKDICNKKILKVIIESGELKIPALIEKVTEDAINCGADFIKTSTGKTSVGVTTAAASIILTVIAKHSINKKIGFKASGGIKNLIEAKKYLEIAEKICGKDFIHNKTFRFGASSLFDKIINSENL